MLLFRVENLIEPQKPFVNVNQRLSEKLGFDPFLRIFVRISFYRIAVAAYTNIYYIGSS